MKQSYKHCTTAEDIPEGPHFAILNFSTVHVPGDERSRTNPGHGYPTYDQSVISYYAYDDETEWKKEVQERQVQAEKGFGPPKFVALKNVTRASVKTTVQVDID